MPDRHFSVVTMGCKFLQKWFRHGISAYNWVRLGSMPDRHFSVVMMGCKFLQIVFATE